MLGFDTWAGDVGEPGVAGDLATGEQVADEVVDDDIAVGDVAIEVVGERRALNQSAREGPAASLLIEPCRVLLENENLDICCSIIANSVGDIHASSIALEGASKISPVGMP